MSDRSRVSHWTVLAASALLLLAAAACNSSIDDPANSEAQVVLAATSPTTACIDVDGSEQATPSGTVTAFTDAVQSMTFESRVRGSGDVTPWMDVILTTVDVSYVMNDALPVPAPYTTSIGAVTVPAGGTGILPGFKTVPVGYIGPFAEFSTSGRLGTARLTFHGKDAAGNDVVVKGQASIGTYTICSEGGS